MNAKEFLQQYPSRAKELLTGIDDPLLIQMIEDYAEQQAVAFARHCNNRGKDDRFDVRYKHFIKK